MTATARILLFTEDGESGPLYAKLKARGYEPVAANDPASAADLTRRKRPEIAIVEAGSAVEGSKLAASLRQGDDERPLPAIIIGDDAPWDTDDANVEFLPRGYHDAELFNRLDLLARLITMQDELRRRTETTRAYGVEGPKDVTPPDQVADARLLLLADADRDVGDISSALGRHAKVTLVHTPHEAIDRLLRDPFDAAIVVTGADPHVSLDFCADTRSNSRLYNVPVLLVTRFGQFTDPAAPYAAGASDVVDQMAGPERLVLRTLHLVRLQRYREAMQEVYRTARHFATSDALTGLFSHGFLHGHLERMATDALAGGKALSVGLFVLENLAPINAVHGYVAGDRALRQVGGMIGSLVRAEDLPARIGGNEFCVVLPDTPREAAEPVLHRIAGVINYTEFSLPDIDTPISIDLATGCASLEPGDDARSLVRRARAAIRR
jgi:two-component system cell cycle response regulator